MNDQKPTVSDERVRELHEWFARPADAGLAWNATMRRRDDVAAICAELLEHRADPTECTDCIPHGVESEFPAGMNPSSERWCACKRGRDAKAAAESAEALDLLSQAVTAEKNDFDLPADWIHRASAATGAAVGSEFVPKRAKSSEVHRMRAALTAVHDEFVRWDILPADKCREMRKALRQLLAEVRR
jgi:hypothetical protein